MGEKKSVKEDDKCLILKRSKYAFAIMNKFPYNNGHILVAPYRHVKSLEMMKDEEILDMMRLLRETKIILDDIMKPDGYNIGWNIGRSAGAGIEGHAHIHIVPRWNGDTNFMPVFAETKIISESLVATLKKLKKKYDNTRRAGKKRA